MSRDVNGQFFGNLYGQDRIGQTTPDLESSEWLRPWLPVAYPAPYLPTLRQDQGHPKLASIVIGAHQLVGQDKNGGLVPAGLFSGTQAPAKALAITHSQIEGGTGILTSTKSGQLKAGESIVITGLTNTAALNGTFVVQTASASEFTVDVASADVAGATDSGSAILKNAGQYCVIAYSPSDIRFAFNPQTGARVASAGEFAVLAAPSDAAAGDTVTLPSGQVLTIRTGDVTFGQACDLFPTGKARPIGAAVRNVYQYIGGVNTGANINTTSSATGINYVLDGVVPVGFLVLNYMHEMGTAIQTQFVLKLPWIGATPTTLTQLAATDGITGYFQGLGRSFTHFTGASGVGGFSYGSAVVASSQANGTDAGNFSPYDPAVHNPSDIVGRVIGIQNLNPVGFLGRVRTQFDRPMVGPMVDPNPVAIRMGGSATRGLPYHISVTTDGLFIHAIDQAKTLRPEYSTHVIVRINL
jgi:hypothetical protein